MKQKHISPKSIAIFFLLSCFVCVHAVNLEYISEKKRYKLLLPIAKEVILRYGPDYYREDPKPYIGRALRTKEFKVVYPAKLDENFEFDDAARVYFDNETGLPDSVTFGNGIGVIINDVYKSYLAQKYFGKKKYKGIDGKKLLDEEVVSPVKYQTVKFKITEEMKIIRMLPFKFS